MKYTKILSGSVAYAILGGFILGYSTILTPNSADVLSPIFVLPLGFFLFFPSAFGFAYICQRYFLNRTNTLYYASIAAITLTVILLTLTIQGSNSLESMLENENTRQLYEDESARINSVIFFSYYVFLAVSAIFLPLIESIISKHEILSIKFLKDIGISIGAHFLMAAWWWIAFILLSIIIFLGSW